MWGYLLSQRWHGIPSLVVFIFPRYSAPFSVSLQSSNRKDHISLNMYNLVIKYLASSQHEDQPINKKEVWRILYPKEDYNDTKMRRLSSDLIRYAFAFLAFKQYKKNAIREQTFLLEALNETSLSKHCNFGHKPARIKRQYNLAYTSLIVCAWRLRRHSVRMILLS